MKKKISDRFTIKEMILFSLPCIGMQLVDNTYQVADGYFISNYIGVSAFAAENLIFPMLLIVLSIGTVFGAGSSALVASFLGKKNEKKACELMTFLLCALLLVGVLASALLYVLMPRVSVLGGAQGSLISDCTRYGRVLALFMPLQMLCLYFQSLLVAADQTNLGFISSVVNAAVNIVLDYLFVAVFGWGLAGAAVATGIAWTVCASIPVAYFFRQTEKLHFVPFTTDFRALGQACGNGFSEMIDSVAYAIIAVLFNHQLMRYFGEYGVAAYAVTEYVSGIFLSVFFGFCISMTPVVGYHYGARNTTELKNLKKSGLTITVLAGVGMALLAFSLAEPIAALYTKYDVELMALAVHALRCCSLAYIISGATQYSAAYFTGLGDGLSSAMIAVTKSFLFPLILMMAIPRLVGADGLWFVTPISEVLSVIFILVWVKVKGEKYAEHSE